MKNCFKNDPEFLQVYLQFASSKNHMAKFEVYERVAGLVTAYLSGIWPEDVTAMEKGGFLKRLLGESDEVV